MASIKQLAIKSIETDEAIERRRYASAITGKYTDDGSGALTFNENLQSNQMHARLSNPDGQPVVVNYTEFDGTLGAGALIKKDPLNTKEWRLVGPDYAISRQSFTGALPGIFTPPIPGELSKSTIIARQLQMLRLSKTATAAMKVRIKSGWLSVDGAITRFPETISATISAPGSSDERQWLIAGINPDTLALTTATSTARVSISPLSISELTTLLAVNAGSILWVGAVELFNGMSAIYEDSITDVRAFAPDMGRPPLNIVAKTANYTATAVDEIINCDASGGSFTITLPTSVGISGKRYDVRKSDSSGNTVTIDADGSETINDAATQIITAQYVNVTVVSDGANWIII